MANLHPNDLLSVDTMGCMSIFLLNVLFMLATPSGFDVFCLEINEKFVRKK